MKRRFCIALLALTSFAAGALGFAACDEKPSKDTHTHEYGNWTVITAATCTESGEQRQYCSCGEFKSEEIYARGHDVEKHSGQDADCFDDGWNDYEICTREGCGYTTYKEIPAHHEYDPDGICKKCGTSQSKYHHDEIDGDNVAYESLTDPNVTEVVVPSTVVIDGTLCTVTTVSDWAFKGTNVKSVTISEGVESIGAGVFENCKSLTEVKIPDSVVSIGMGAFDGCDNLQYNVKDNGCYLGSTGKPYRILVKILNTSVASFKVDESTEIVCYGVLSQCKNLRSVTLGNNILDLNSFFVECAKLENVTLPDNFNAIADYMFYGCESLKTIKIPASVTSIGDSAFSNSGLTEIEIPERVATIGTSAFEGTKLTSVIFSQNPSEIGDNAFCNCENLEFVQLPGGLVKISEGMFTGCANLKYVYIPGTVQEIGSSVFDYCGNGEKVKIYYDGTAYEWAQITHSNGNYSEWATVYYFSGNHPATDGNYWSWGEDGNPTPYQT